MSNKTNINFSKAYSPIVVTLFIGITITLVASITARQQEVSIAKYEFTKRATDAARTVNHLFANSINATTFLAAFINSSDKVELDDFHSYSKKIIKTHKVIQALEWIPRVETDNLAGFEKANQHYLANFTVTEKNDKDQIVPVSKREVYFPVQFVIPLAGNRTAIGYDIYSNNTRKEMLLKAAEQNELTASGRVKLIQEKENSFGILVTMPVFKSGNMAVLPLEKNKNLRGYALGVYRVNGIIEQSLLKGSYIPSSFRFIDDSSSPDENLLYIREHNASPQSDWFSYVERINIAGRRYIIQIRENPQVFLSQYSISTFIMLAGLVVTVLTSIYISVIRRRNEELYKSNYKLKKAVDEIRALQGIIPICSYCHAIRDDEGAWNKIEEYISSYSDAQFSHGICPNCLESERKKFKET